MHARDELQEAELRPVRVLVLIDEEEVEAPLVETEHLRLALEQLDRLHQEIVEVEGVLPLKRPLVGRVDVGGPSFAGGRTSPHASSGTRRGLTSPFLASLMTLRTALGV